MTAFKGTPGPWTVDNPEGSLGSVDAVNDDVRVAQAQEVSCFDRSRGSPRRKANARLMAAAPDLLEASVLFVESIDYLYNITPAWSDDRIYDDLPSSGLAIAYLAARAAIAKALGEQS